LLLIACPVPSVSQECWDGKFIKPQSTSLISDTLEALTEGVPEGVHKALYTHWLARLRPEAVPPQTYSEGRLLADHYDQIALVNVETYAGKTAFRPLVVGETVTRLFSSYSVHSCLTENSPEYEYATLLSLLSESAEQMWPAARICFDPISKARYSQTAFPILTSRGYVTQLLCGFQLA